MVESAAWTSIALTSLGWYAALAAFGLAGLVPAAALFDRLASRGVFLARPLGLGVAALATWLVVRLTPVSYGTPAVAASLAGLLAVSLVLAWWRRDALPAVAARWRSVATAEALTVVVFVVVLVVRVQNPDAWGTEKPADLMLLTAVHRAESFPPLDPWLAGERISYYHLGQVQADHVGRLSGVAPERSFNLAVASVGAMAAAGAAGVAGDLARLGGASRRRVAVAAGGTALAGVLLAAPAVGLVQVAAANGLGGPGAWSWLGVEGVPAGAGATWLAPDEFWWWWHTTRVVPGVISEYPAFSLILGDPHAHLLALPLALAAVALAVQVAEGGTPLGWRRWLRRPEQLVLTAAVFAALAMTNAWDVVTFGALWAGAAWWAAARAGWPALLAGFVAARWALLPTALGLALAWPFLGTLDPQPLGLAPVVGEHSDPGRWLLFWGTVLIPSALGGLLVLRAVRPRLSEVSWAAVVAAIPVGAWAAWVLGSGQGAEFASRGWGWVTLAGLVGGVALTGTLASRLGREREAERVALGLVGGALLVLLLTELAHIDDAFPGRLNTAFKFWFHAWVLLALGGGVLAATTVARASMPDWPRWLRVAGWAAAGLWVLSMATPPLAAASRAREGQADGLSAVAYLERVDPNLLQAVRWGQTELDPQEHVVVEAVSDSYESGSRYSSFTGVPTLLAWPGHERQWRGEIAEPARRAAVDAIYRGDAEAQRAAIERWGITHVLVSHHEREAYGMQVHQRFSGWPLVFATSTVHVYQAPAFVAESANPEEAAR